MRHLALVVLLICGCAARPSPTTVAPAPAPAVVDAERDYLLGEIGRCRSQVDAALCSTRVEDIDLAIASLRDCRTRALAFLARRQCSDEARAAFWEEAGMPVCQVMLRRLRDRRRMLTGPMLANYSGPIT
jgi:hypothetical protein